MKIALTALSLIALLPAGAGLAGSNDCFAPVHTWKSQDAAMNVARNRGITVSRLKVDDGCYEIKGRDGQGRKVKLKLDPATLAVVRTKYDGDHGRDGGKRDRTRNSAPAGPVSPPQNGLFSNGVAPTVKVN